MVGGQFECFNWTEFADGNLFFQHNFRDIDHKKEGIATYYITRFHNTEYLSVPSVECGTWRRGRPRGRFLRASRSSSLR